MEKLIKGFENYSIDENGVVKDISTGVVRNSYTNLGYTVVNIRKGNKFSCVGVHRLIAIAFIPNPENKPYVNHLNGVKNDNRLENLEWCTARENNQHAWNTGLNKPKSKWKRRNIVRQRYTVRQKL